jgi:hypothetical protein
VWQDGGIAAVLDKTLLQYFSALDTLTAHTNPDILAYRHPSFGAVSTRFTPVSRFGIPVEVESAGIRLDVDAMAQSLWSKDNNPETAREAVRQFGMMFSSLEHLIPELFLTTDEISRRGCVGCQSAGGRLRRRAEDLYHQCAEYGYRVDIGD